MKLDPMRVLMGFCEEDDDAPSDQMKGVPRPEFEKPCPAGADLIMLPDPAATPLPFADVRACIMHRKSVRAYRSDPLSLAELSFLLWSTQGIQKFVEDSRHAHHAVRRTVPSAGSRHPFETYLAVHDISGLKGGVYRYVGSKHALLFLKQDDDLRTKVTEATLGQEFCGRAPVFFCWSMIPYRTIWRYGLPLSIKAALLDAGHIGQNLHLACEALGLGTCMIGAYAQKTTDALFGLDGQDELAVYMAPVGRPKAAATND